MHILMAELSWSAVSGTSLGWLTWLWQLDVWKILGLLYCTLHPNSSYTHVSSSLHFFSAISQFNKTGKLRVVCPSRSLILCMSKNVVSVSVTGQIESETWRIEILWHSVTTARLSDESVRLIQQGIEFGALQIFLSLLSIIFAYMFATTSILACGRSDCLNVA